MRIDGINIKELDLRWLRQQMALVSQEPALFTASSSAPFYGPAFSDGVLGRIGFFCPLPAGNWPGMCPPHLLLRPLHLQGTIRDNIAFGVEDATDEEVTQAAEAANAMLFIKKAPAGFRTQAESCLTPMPMPTCSRSCCCHPLYCSAC